MGLRLALAWLALGAAAPPSLVLATAHGRGSVEVSAPATRAHDRVWVTRSGGSGIAHGRAQVSCTEPPTAQGSSGTEIWFRFAIGPNGRQEIWRRTRRSGTCTITVTLTGAGTLSVALRAD